MSFHDDHPSSVPESQQAMVGGPSAGALVATAPVAPLPMAVPTTPNFATQQVLRGGMDANTFLHALRRRWLLALCMGTVVGGITAIVLWILFPESSSATALFRVDSEPKSFVFDVNRSNQKYETVQKTQLALLKSYFVLQAAIRDPAIASLSVFARKGDPVQWLQENLDVDFPQQSEILSISLSGDHLAEEQQLVVDAVAKAYQSEVIYAERQRRLTTRDALARSLEKLNNEYTRKLNEFYDMAREIGVPQSQSPGGRDPETELLLSDLSGVQKKKAELETQILDMRTRFAVLKQQLDNPAMLDAEVEAALAQDPTYSMMQNELVMTQMRHSQAAKGTRFGRNRMTAAMERELAEIQNRIAQYRGSMKEQIRGQKASQPNANLQQATKEFQIYYASMQQQWAGLNQQAEKKLEELKNRVQKSVELETRAQELEQLQEIAKDMSIKLESLDVEAEAPDQTERIQLLQPAIVTRGINTMQHYSISALGGIGAFALTCFGIAYVEFIKRRLNGPEQVDEGLGIRVVGTLPSVNGRRAADPNLLVAHVSASIDSVRTLLMHDSTTKRRQVVLVTSSEASEGRTTVASQLAASLARAGRRTLLIDGDIRRPKLHELFDVPLEDGLCEVLRAEVDVADVIRPTHSEGLWLLTAGYCDRDSIQALATEQMQPIFDKLRAEYDFIIIDGAPALGISDALIFGQYSDGVILSVRRDHSQMPKIYQTAELLRGVGIRVIGAVVNGVPTKADDRITQLQLITSKSEMQQEQPAT